MDARLDRPNLLIILVSVREGRAGEPVANWFIDVARRHGAFDVHFVDLAQVGLPLIDEPEHPRFARYHRDYTKRWSATVAAADAFVAVTPEYNYGAPPSLINALDFLYQEWLYKAFGFASYGGVSGGTRSAQMSKQIVTALKMMPMAEQVTIPHVTRFIKDGAFEADENLTKQADALLTELHRWATALMPLRNTS